MIRLVGLVAGLVIASLVCLANGASAQSTRSTIGWSTYKNARFGFQLSYPGGLFEPVSTPNPDSGSLWRSADGSANLIATAAPNETGGSLQSYREFVMRETYAGARFDYAPVRDNWFVLSGQKGDKLFYERITFACQGRYIYGWQVNYPVNQKRKFDAIIEAIHNSYRVGHGESGSCGPVTQ